LADGHWEAGAAAQAGLGAPADGSAEGGIRDLIYLPSGKGALKPGEYYTEHVTPLAGLRAALGARAEVTYEKGCELLGEDRAGFSAAVAAAARADVAVVVLGGRSGLHESSTVGEARDATDLRLTGVQEELVSAVAATGTPTVLVVMSGRAHVLSEVANLVQALLVAWPLGEQGGNALADVLLGKAEPTGRLAVTLPRSTGQVPLYSSHRSGGGRSVFYGDYTDCACTPLFSFGHGLGYTTFGYSNITVEARDTSSNITVGVTVTNTGAREGEELVQLYVSDLVASVARPDASLIGFARLCLGPGEPARVTFAVHPSRLAFYDEAMRFVVEPGLFRFAVGASSSDVRQEAVVNVTGPVASYSQRSIVAVTAMVERCNGGEALSPTHK
jgi:beta-glucosidase